MTEASAREIAARLEAAVAAHGAGDLQAARAGYEAVLSQVPEQADALHLLGVIADQEGRHEEAVDLIGRAIARSPRVAEFHSNLGNALLALGREAEAEAAYGQAVALDPGFADGHVNLGNLRTRHHDEDGARLHYEAALKSAPANGAAHLGLGSLLLNSKQAEAALPHLVAAVRAMPKSAAARDTLGMALRQLKRFSEALVQNSKAVALAPTQARYRENLASTLVGIDSRKSKAQALREFETVLEQHPDRVEAMTGLAALQIRMQQPLAALAVLERALRLAPDSLDVLVNRAAALSLVGRTEEALACCGRLIELFPDNSIVFNQRGIVREHAGDYEGALADFAAALQAGHGRKPDIIADAEFNHVLLLMSLGRLAEAWPLYQARMNVKSADPRGAAFAGRLPPWDGTVRPGQRILVWGEQGVGDQILFGSMLPELVRAGADVVFGGDPRLVPLFERSIEGLRCEAVGLPIKPDVVDRVAGLADVQAGLGDIGIWLRPDLAAAPPPCAYLKPDPVRVAALRRRYESYGKRHIVGITWRSSNPRIGAMKSVALLDWAPVLTQKDVLFVDMQYGDTAEERAQVRDRLGVDILHDDSIDALKDLDGVVAQAAALDLLVGSSNSGIHMAAAAGTLCWVMVPGGLGRLWYWHLSRSDSPWYPNIRLFRQSAGLAADWRATIEDVAQALRDRLRERPA